MKNDKPQSEKGGRRLPISNDEIFQAMHEEAIGDEGVIELGPTTAGQGGLFEKIRAGITPGEVLRSTFDQAVINRCKIHHEGKQMPPAVDEATFDAEVKKILNFTDAEVELFDNGVCAARMETRDENDRGVYVWRERASGFGPEVFGIAYDGVSGLWSATNEHGMHAHCEENLRVSISEKKGYDFKPGIISGFIFNIQGFNTPIMTPFGYPFLSREAIRKAVEDLWAWKRFIIVANVEDSEGKYRWRQLFTPDYAESVVHVN